MCKYLARGRSTQKSRKQITLIFPIVLNILYTEGIRVPMEHHPHLTFVAPSWSLDLPSCLSEVHWGQNFYRRQYISRDIMSWSRNNRRDHLEVTKNLADRGSQMEVLNELSWGKDCYMTSEENVVVNSSKICKRYAVLATWICLNRSSAWGGGKSFQL